jgi:hypothetical protein
MGTMSALLDRTRVLARTRGRAAADADDPGSAALTAALAACWAAGSVLALCVAVAVTGWFVGSTGTATDAVRVGTQAWLLGLGSGLRVGPVTVTAIPLGLTRVSAAVLWRAGRWTASTARATDLRAVAAGTAIVAGVFAAVALLAALLAATGEAAVGPLRAFGAALLLAVVSTGLGMLREAGLLTDLWAWLPEHARAALRGGAAGGLLVFAAGALLASAALAVDLTDAANVAQSTGAGVVGGAVLTLAGVLLLPNAALLGVAYLLGPGFAFGAGTTVAPGGVTLGRVPAFPLLAALPDEGAAPAWAAGLLAVPVLAGVLAAVVALRHHPVDGLLWALLRGGSAGLAGGVVVGAATALAGGAVGPGRMGETGAPALVCLATAAAAMALGGAVAGPLAHWRAR